MTSSCTMTKYCYSTASNYKLFKDSNIVKYQSMNLEQLCNKFDIPSNNLYNIPAF